MDSKLKERIIFERYLNNFKYDKVGLGKICAHSINERVFNNGKQDSFISLVKLFVFHLSLFMVYNKRFVNPILILLPNSTERVSNQFNPIINQLETYSYNSVIVSDFYRQAKLLSLFKWIFNTLCNFYFYLKISLSSKNISLNTILVQTLRYQIAYDIIKKRLYKFILVDLDRSSFNSPIICAANTLNVENATLVHGMVFPPNLYIPIISKKMYCWGEFHKDYFLKLQNRNTKYIIAGNTSFNYKNVIISQENKLNNIVFISQNFTDELQYQWLEKISKITTELPSNICIYIKSHPADKYDELKKYVTNNIKVLPLDFSVKNTMDFADLFIVISSTFALEAIFNSKPVVFLASPDDRIELANLFTLNSNSSIIKNENQLLDFIKSITIERITSIIKEQNMLANKFCKYHGDIAGKIVTNDILKSIEKSNQ